MTITVIVPVVAAIIGAVLYLIASNPKAVELGRMTFFAGILVSLLVTANSFIHV
jgi:hypothetical protein